MVDQIQGNQNQKVQNPYSTGLSSVQMQKANLANSFRGKGSFLRTLQGKMDGLYESIATGEKNIEVDGVLVEDPQDPSSMTWLMKKINDWTNIGKVVQNQGKGVEDIEKSIERLIG